MTADRIIAGAPNNEDEPFETSLRPRHLDEYIGQDKVKDNLRIGIEAAKQRGDPLDHVLLYGPPGLGKTTLANIIASEMGVSVRTTSGPAIERPGDLAAILTNLQQDDVLFIDEVHRLSGDAFDALLQTLEEPPPHVVFICATTGATLRGTAISIITSGKSGRLCMAASTWETSSI